MVKFNELCGKLARSFSMLNVGSSFGLCFVMSGGLVLFGTSGFAKESSKQSIKLALSGSSTIAPLASDLAKAFEKKFPGSRLDVQSGGSSKGLSDVRSKLSDIGMVSRDLTEKESDLRGTPIAYDGIAMIAHKDNPVTELNDKQIVSIYTGKITNWKELGGLDHPITAVNKAEGRSTLELFLQFFSLKNVDVKAQMIVGENEQAIKFVGGSKWSIGYVSVGTAEYASTVSKTIKTLKLNGIDATLINVKNKTYPLRRTLNFVNLDPSSVATKSFLAFVKDPEAKKLIEDHFFVPL